MRLPSHRQHGGSLAEKARSATIVFGPQNRHFAVARQQRFVFVDQGPQARDLLGGAVPSGFAVSLRVAQGHHGEKGEGACAHGDGERGSASQACRSRVLSQCRHRRQEGERG